MNAKVDQFCDGLRDRPNAIDNWLESVKAEIKALPGKARKAHESKLREARARLQAQKERVEQTRAELKSPPQLAVELLVDSVIGWKVEPDAREPHAGPDAAEARVAATLDHAVAGIDEVGDAMLAADAARLHSTK
jgi:hypothetical protein